MSDNIFNDLVIGNMEVCHPTMKEPVKITGERGHTETFPRAFNAESDEWIKSISQALDDGDSVRIYFSRSRLGFQLDSSGDVYRRDIKRDKSDPYNYDVSLVKCGEWELIEHEATEKAPGRTALGVMDNNARDSYVFEERDGVKYHSPNVKFSVHLMIDDLKGEEVDITLPVYECNTNRVRAGFRKVSNLIEKRMRYETDYITKMESKADGKPWKRPRLRHHEGLVFSPNVLKPGMADEMRFQIYETPITQD